MKEVQSGDNPQEYAAFALAQAVREITDLSLEKNPDNPIIYEVLKARDALSQLISLYAVRSES